MCERAKLDEWNFCLLGKMRLLYSLLLCLCGGGGLDDVGVGWGMGVCVLVGLYDSLIATVYVLWHVSCCPHLYSIHSRSGHFWENHSFIRHRIPLILLTMPVRTRDKTAPKTLFTLLLWMNDVRYRLLLITFEWTKRSTLTILSSSASNNTHNDNGINVNRIYFIHMTTKYKILWWCQPIITLEKKLCPFIFDLILISSHNSLRLNWNENGGEKTA